MVLIASFCLVLMFICRYHYAFGSPIEFQQSDLLLSNLFISDPFQADPTSSYNSTINLLIEDPNHPELKALHCHTEWKAGLSPPSASDRQCENVTMRVWFPERTFNGVQKFQLHFAHTIIDTSLGPCPQSCYLTKYAIVNLTYPGTPNWACDIDSAVCEQTLNTTIPVPIYLAVA